MTLLSDNSSLAERLSSRMEEVEAILQREIRLDDLQLDPALLHLAQAGG